MKIGAAGAALLPFAKAGVAKAESGRGGGEIAFPEAEWEQKLTREQYYILRQAGTERPRSSPLDKEYRDGTFKCAGCSTALFPSKTKFDSGTGWPSFYKPIDGAVAEETEGGFFMARTEVRCKKCQGHLGHVFNDGPRPTGLRYCMNGAAMVFAPSGAA